MSLRQLAESDLGLILEDRETGFGWPITITDPTGFSGTGPLTGFSNDIAQVIDPDTGQAVSGRLATVSVRTALLTSVGLGRPVGVADAGSKPWIVEFEDINLNPYKFKVSEAPPDRGLGLITLILELYE